MRSLLTALLLLAAVGPTSAGTDWTMTCRNPHAGYELVFNPGSRVMTVNPDTDKTTYAVLGVEGHHVVGMVGHGSGLGFVADFTARLVDFYADGKLSQRDTCTADTGL